MTMKIKVHERVEEAQAMSVIYGDVPALKRTIDRAATIAGVGPVTVGMQDRPDIGSKVPSVCIPDVSNVKWDVRMDDDGGCSVWKYVKNCCVCKEPLGTSMDCLDYFRREFSSYLPKSESVNEESEYAKDAKDMVRAEYSDEDGVFTDVYDLLNDKADELADDIIAAKSPDNSKHGELHEVVYDELCKMLVSTFGGTPIESKKSETGERMAINDYADKRFFDPDEFVKYVRKVVKDGSYLSVDSVVSMDILNKANRLAQNNDFKKSEAENPKDVIGDELPYGMMQYHDDDTDEWLPVLVSLNYNDRGWFYEGLAPTDNFGNFGYDEFSRGFLKTCKSGTDKCDPELVQSMKKFFTEASMDIDKVPTKEVDDLTAYIPKGVPYIGKE